jgi:hypothetical protein
MALRMMLVALIVLALAEYGPANAILGPLADRPARDVVIVLDGSYSMGRRDVTGQTPWDAARRWLHEYVAQQGRAERTALLVARRPPLAWQAELTGDRERLRSRIDDLPPPRGNAGLPAAVAEAARLLQASSAAAEQEIVILTDRQFFGWADEAARRQWETVGRLLQAEATRRPKAVPRLRVVDVAHDCAAPAPNLALGPLTTSRPLVAVGQSVKFASSLMGDGPLPRRIRVAVDGEPTQDVPLPAKLEAATPSPLIFTQRFDKPGLHAVTLTLESDSPDALAADNEQHAVVEVLAELPVLLVDGDREIRPESSTFFLDKALAGSQHNSVVVPRLVPAANLTPAYLLGDRDHRRPRVVVLADVPQWTPAIEDAIETFLQDGGGVLVLIGPRVQPAVARYNQRLFRDGRGWLPARLAGQAGERGGAGTRPEPRSFQHPALELLRQAPGGGLGQVVFPRWWKLRADEKGAGAVVARLANGDPFLVEKPFGKGRAILCSVPPDRGWESPLPGTWEFPVLIHELVYFLAGAGARDWRLDDAQPMRVGPSANGTLPARLIVETPDAPSKTVEARAWPWTDADTGAIGLYRVEREVGSRQFFVVPPDLRESEDRRCTNEEWTGVLRLLPPGVTTESAASDEPMPIWWLVLLAVMGLLCVEVYLTRRLALARRVAAAVS